MRAETKASKGQQLISEAERDGLTRLYNRSFFTAYAERLYRDHPDKPMDAILLNVDRFHTLNTLNVGRALVVDCKNGEMEHTTLNNENLRLSVRNLQNYKYLRPEGVNVYDVLHYGGVVVTQDSLKKLEARLKG